jgi:hypothetical protein
MIGKARESRNILLSAVRYLDKYSEDNRNVIPLSQGDSPMAISTELTEACSNG